MSTTNNFTLPTEFSPRKELIWDILLTDQRIIDVVAKSLVDAPEGSYVYAPAKLPANQVHCILYMPKDNQDSQAPIIVNVMEKLDMENFRGVLEHCLDLHDRCGSFPVCFIISQGTVSDDILQHTSPNQQLSLLKEYRSTFGTKKCLLLSADDINKDKIMDHPLLEIAIATKRSNKVTINDDDSI